jgi:hypothetical protein
MTGVVPFMLVFRFLHILGGVLWVGSTFLVGAFLGPSGTELGAPAIPLLTAVIKKRKAVKVIGGIGGTTVLAGWATWLWDMHVYGSLTSWITSRFGIAITIGGVLATIALFVGALSGARAERLVDLGNEIVAAGGLPSPGQQSELDWLSRETERYGKIDFALLVLAVLAMATARYW